MEPVDEADESRRGAAPLLGASSAPRGIGGGVKVRNDSTRRNRASMDRREFVDAGAARQFVGAGAVHGQAPCPPGSSTPPPPPVAGLWPGSRASSGTNFPPHDGNSPQNPWGYTQGGFVNLLQQPYVHPSPQGENFHFVGLINQNFNGTSPASGSKETPTPEGSSDKQGKKRWTHDEEVRLANAWLNNSYDPINGCDKKGDSFWKDITEEFNKTAPENRTRDINQLKIHWTRLKTAINDFNGFWSTANKLHTSGYSHEQLMEEAQKMYINKHKKAFTLVHWWSTLKNEPKWCAHLARLAEKEKNKSTTIDVTDDRDLSRPIGREAAKAELRGKRKKEDILDGIVILGENINKVVEMQKERKVEREKVSQTQLEISRTNLKAAKEQKYAKLWEVYNSILNQDTSKMTEKEKASREKMMEKMELRLLADDDADS